MNNETVYLPKSFGVMAEDRQGKPLFSEILSKGSSSLSRSKLYHTVENYQTRMEFEICESDGKDTKKLGVVEIKELPADTKGMVTVYLRLSYSPDGILTVTATDARTNKNLLENQETHFSVERIPEHEGFKLPTAADDASRSDCFLGLAAGGQINWGSALRDVKSACRKLIQNFIDLKQHRLGIITCAHEANILHDLSHDAQSLLKAVDRLEAGRDNNMAAAFNIASKRFDTYANDGRKRTIITVNAGVPADWDKLRETVNDLKQRGVKIIAIGANVNNSFLGELAGNRNDAYQIASMSNLEDKFRQIFLGDDSAKRKAELQRQREAELQRQREAELQRQREAELQRQREAELQRQRENERHQPHEQNLSIDKMRRIVESSSARRVEKFAADGFDTSATLEITDTMPLTLFDDFRVNCPVETIYCDAAALAVTGGKIVTVGNIVLKDGQAYLTADAENIDFGTIGNKQGKFYSLYLFPKDADLDTNNYRGEIYELKGRNVYFKEIETTEKLLCIDFGTSNTTAGSYGIKNPSCHNIELTKFIGKSGTEIRFYDMFPTLIYVSSIEPGNEKYLLGYDAREKIIAEDYQPKASTFLEIKRWIDSLDKTEKITDEEGNTRNIRKGDIVQKYLREVIKLSEQYFKVRFKRLHFTAPVKLKDGFLRAVKKMLPDYEIETKDSLDEGIAIVYDHIRWQMENDSRNEGREQEILVIDCGGGTTDLANCKYQFNLQESGSHKLELQTRFESGDQNFGGNNVTWRILQMLKIKLAAVLSGKPDVDIQKIVAPGCSWEDILGEIDEDYDAEGKDNKSQLYAEFERLYEKASEIIPTRFFYAENSETERHSRRNYYYLWQMAEAIKIEFYKVSGAAVQIDFDKQKYIKIVAPDLSHYYLMYRIDGKFLDTRRANFDPLKKISVTNNEIRRLLYPDIYDLLNSLLNPLIGKKDLTMTRYRLSGQSCKITLFHELLKEFVPGRRMRMGGKNPPQEESSSLKLACIKGSIAYWRDKFYDDVQPEIIPGEPEIIYEVLINLPGNRRMKLIGAGGELKVRDYSANVQHADIFITDRQGKERRSIPYTFQSDSTMLKKFSSFAEVLDKVRSMTFLGAEKLDSLTQHFIDLESGGRFLFAVPSNVAYGFHVFELHISNDGIYQLAIFPTDDDGFDVKFYSYESDNLSLFFNGDR